MTDHPYKPFNDAVKNIKPEQKDKKPNIDKIRDKDNAAPQLKPGFSSQPAKNTAPPGHKGIERNLPTPEHQKAKEDRTIQKGSAKRDFKSIVTKTQNKDRGFDR